MEPQDTTNSGQNPLPVTTVAKQPDVVGERGIVKKEGKVIEALPNAFFKVVLEDGTEIMGFLSGKMRLNRIKILPGDKVTLEMSEYDMKKGRIVYRLK